MGYSGAGGKLFHKKTRSKKSRDTVPLTGIPLSYHSIVLKCNKHPSEISALVMR